MDNKYELMFIVQIMDDEATDAIVQKVQDLIEKNNGTIDKVDRWGKRRLAYEVKKQNEGYYTVIDFSIDPASITEIDRVIKINESIIRHLVLRRDE